MALSAAVDVRLGRQGRLVIPARLRKVLGLASGDVLVAHAEAGQRLVLERRRSALTRLHARFATIPPQISLVEELLVERRVEARRDTKR